MLHFASFATRKTLGEPITVINWGRGVTPGDAHHRPAVAVSLVLRSMRAGGLPPATPPYPDFRCL